MKTHWILIFLFLFLAASSVQAQPASKPALGAVVRSDSMAVAAKKQSGVQEEGGVLVEEVVANSSAQAGGILKNDIIVRINDATINTASEFVALIQTFKVGDNINLSLYRNKKLIVKNVQLKARTN
ncbi:MAG: PDZ domain-containing protein [Ferruginibacter sp.]|nr:PDZ domain-containing protein [Cytophagales bacterium]